MNILVLLAGLTSFLDSIGLAGLSSLDGDAIHRLYFFLIPLFFNLALSVLIAKERNLDLIGTVLISMVCFFRVSGFLSVSPRSELMSSHGSILSSILVTFLTVQLLTMFGKRSRFHLVKRNANISPHLRNTFNLLIPGLLTVLCLELGGEMLRFILNLALIDQLWQSVPKLVDIGGFQELILFKVLSLLTWFLGIHGEHSADGLFRFLKDVPAGTITSLELKTFHDVFMNIGGAGSTFVIPIILLLKQKTQRLTSLAKLSLPFSLFNVNELLLFGLPIILNPQFLLPFFLAPFVNCLIVVSAVHLGLFTVSPDPISWMSPPLYSAYIVSGGSWAAVLTQIVCLVTDGCLYYPFLAKVWQRSQNSDDLQLLFSHDAYSFLNDERIKQEEQQYYTQQKRTLTQLDALAETLDLLKGGDFLLYYQPKYSAQTAALVGAEVLLRFRDHNHAIHPPFFLPVLYEHGCSNAIDQKVLDLAITQVLLWRTQGFHVPRLSINFDKEFLLDPPAVDEFLRVTSEHHLQFYVEITEHTYAVEQAALASVVQRIRKAGHLVSIDDFGAGYSCLTSLLMTHADEIKLDRQLVVPPRGEHKRGQILLEASIKLCHDLGFSVVAEGVEEAAQLALVKRLGVDVVQGYLTGKPMNAKQMSHLLSQRAIPHSKIESGEKDLGQPQGDRTQSKCEQ